MRIGREFTARLIPEGEGHFQIEGEVVFATVMKLLEESRELFTDCEHIALDFAGVTRINTAGLGLVIEWLRWARHEGRALSISHPPAALLSLARICEAEGIIAPALAAAEEA
ncbi:MAG: STAS domain-containing protein [Gammaproteobacteria bacterium]